MNYSVAPLDPVSELLQPPTTLLTSSQPKKFIAPAHHHHHPNRHDLRRATAGITARDYGVVSVALPKLPFLCVWVFVLLTRALCTSFLLTLSLLYSVLATPELEYYAQLLSPYSRCLYPPIAWLAACGGAAHMYQMCKIIYCSIRARCPCFEVTKPSTASANSSRSNSSTWLFVLMARFSFCGTTVRGVLRRLRFELFDRQGFFGVESAYFELRFLVREFVEMVSQTVQVYSASQLIAKVWINHLYVSIVFVNSFSTPLAKHFTHRSPALERLLCLTADLFLDLVTSVVVPLIIAVPYKNAFNTELYMFNIVNLYNPSWFINLVMENRQIFVHNGFDLVLKVAPHLSIYGCLGSVQSLMRLRTSSRGGIPHVRATHCQVVPGGHSDPLLSAGSESRGPAHSEVVSAKSCSCTQTRIRRLSIRIRHMQRHKLQGHKSTLVHLGFILWGCVIVAFHLTAIYSSSSIELCGCHLQLHPWFTNKCACSVFEYNCYRQGTTSPSEDSLAPLDEKSLTVLVFSHCPELVVPKRVKRFSRLTGIEVWNSSIVSWGQEAGVTSQSHPAMTYICLVNVRMAGIPEGLLYDLPSELQDIEITRTNLSSLPEDLDVRWASVKTLYIEYAQLKECPSVLSRMSIDDFSLIGNDLAQLPLLTAGVDGSSGGYYTLSLSNNPLTTLPEYTGDMSEMFFLSLENTQLKELPGWVDQVQQRGHHVFMYGTPFCYAKSEAEIGAKYNANAVLTCMDTNPRMMGRYPYEEMHAQLQP